MQEDDKREKTNPDRRDVLKTMGVAAAGMVAGALTPAQAADVPQAVAAEHNVYGSPPGSGVTIPPYYLPTPSVKNKTNYFPQSEPLGPDEMRIIFMGSQPWPPRMTQASTCIKHPMVACSADPLY